MKKLTGVAISMMIAASAVFGVATAEADAACVTITDENGLVHCFVVGLPPIST